MLAGSGTADPSDCQLLSGFTSLFALDATGLAPRVQHLWQFTRPRGGVGKQLRGTGTDQSCVDGRASQSAAMRESLSPLQKLQNRYLWKGSVLAGLAALVLARLSWVRLQYVTMLYLVGRAAA